MLNENAKKWVAALRSGEYKQAQSQLCTPDGCYCCLGVACEVYQKETGNELPEEWTRLLVLDYEASPVAEWLWLQDECGHFDTDSLTEINDDGKSFDTIADIIESEPAGLFVETEANNDTMR